MVSESQKRAFKKYYHTHHKVEGANEERYVKIANQSMKKGDADFLYLLQEKFGEDIDIEILLCLLEMKEDDREDRRQYRRTYRMSHPNYNKEHLRKWKQSRSK